MHQNTTALLYRLKLGSLGQVISRVMTGGKHKRKASQERVSFENEQKNKTLTFSWAHDLLESTSRKQQKSLKLLEMDRFSQILWTVLGKAESFLNAGSPLSSRSTTPQTVHR